MSAPPADPAAVPLSGEAFTVIAVLFVAGMLLIVFLRARSKARAGRRASRMDRSGESSGYGAWGAGERRSDPDNSGADAGDGGDGD